jgi:beta-propeller repeat-containing protein
MGRCKLILVSTFYIGSCLGAAAVYAAAMESSSHATQTAPTGTTAPKKTLSPPTASKSAHPPQLRIENLTARTPLYFEANRGQTDPSVGFLSRGSGYNLFLTPGEAVLALKTQLSPRLNPLTTPWKPRLDRITKVNAEERRESVLRMKLVGANSEPEMIGVEELPGKANYFIGNDPKQWDTKIPTYAKVKYNNVYPGIDLIYYGKQAQLEHDFIVQPGANPKSIQFAFEGYENLEKTKDGDLIIKIPDGKIVLKKPRIYQEIKGRKREIGGGYVLNHKSHSVGFRIAAYDTTKPLVIDPVISFILSVGQAEDVFGFGIALDPNNNIYLVGMSASMKFPPATAEAFQRTLLGSWDAFVLKFDAQINLVYATYLGGNDSDNAGAIAVDNSGSAYIAGYTFSSDFPTRIGPRLTWHGCTSAFDCVDGFIAKLTPDGSGIVYGSYIGGTGNDFANAVAVDAAGNAYVTGFTDSADFPLVVGPQSTLTISGGDSFVAKIKADGTAYEYAGFVNGCIASAIAVDNAGNAYIAGETMSGNFPATVGPNLNYGGTGDQSEGDGFVAKIKTDGSGFEYAGYIGGAHNDSAYGIAVDAAGNAYVTGRTDSDQTSFPVKIGPQLTYSGGVRDAFVAKVKADGTDFEYLGYIGGAGFEQGAAIAVDSTGSAYVAGATSSDQTTFPVLLEPDATYNGGVADGFVAKVKADGSGYEYAGYIGGSGDDGAFGIAVDNVGSAYVHGYTRNSPPTRFAAKITHTHDMAVLKITAARSAKSTAQTNRPVSVQIQNRSSHTETIHQSDLGDGVTTGLVRLTVDPVDTDGESCAPATVSLDTVKNAKLFAKNPAYSLASKKTLTVNYLVSYNCSTAKPLDKTDPAPGDYRHGAAVYHDVLGIGNDVDTVDDVCPRSVTPPFIVDPNPDGTIKDPGCGAVKPDKTFGADVVTNIVP